MGFSKEEYWSVLPFPSPGDLPGPGTEPWSPALQVISCIAGKFFTDWATREALQYIHDTYIHSLLSFFKVFWKQNGTNEQQQHGLLPSYIHILGGMSPCWLSQMTWSAGCHTLCCKQRLKRIHTLELVWPGCSWIPRQLPRDGAWVCLQCDGRHVAQLPHYPKHKPADLQKQSCPANRQLTTNAEIPPSWAQPRSPTQRVIK